MSVNVVITGVVDISQVGEYTLTYIASDDIGNTSQVTRTVIVQDTIAPLITISGDSTFIVERFTTFNDPGYITTGSDVSVNVVVTGVVDTSQVGQYTLTYIASDDIGNTSQVTRTVIVQDTIAPLITISGDNPFIVERFTAFNDPGYDISGSDLSVNVVVTGVVDTSQVGQYTLTYIASDDEYNNSLTTRQVFVVEKSILNSINIDISDQYTNNIVKSLVDSSNTKLIINDKLNINSDFAINFNSIPYTYRVTHLDNKVNNMIIFINNIKDEIITLSPINIDTDYSYVNIYINNSISKFDSLVNLYIETQKNYNLLLIDSNFNQEISNYNPTINILGDNPLQVIIYNQYIEPGVTATDYDMTDISNLITTYSNIDISSIGNYNIYYRVENILGYQDIKSRSIIVTDI